MTTKILVNNLERKLFWFLVAFLGAALAWYMYSAILLTISVMARDSAVSMAHDVRAMTSEHEREYITLQNSVTLARAHELGFVEVRVKFTPETPQKLSLVTL